MDTTNMVFSMTPDSVTGTGLREGVVIRKNLGSYLVRAGGESYTCGLSARASLEITPPSSGLATSKSQPRESGSGVDSVVVGDRVRFHLQSPGTGRIISVLPRGNSLSRRAASPHPRAPAVEQVIAANVDQIVAVFAAAQPAPKWNLLDRYLVMAEAAMIPAVICLTKSDLIDRQAEENRIELNQVLVDYQRIGYRVIGVSVISGVGLADLQNLLNGQVSILLGKSGVGKTSLLNALEPGLGARVGEISRATGKGRHTTAHLELVPYRGGGIIDTPGQREFGLWDIDTDQLSQFFPEIRPWIGQCRFSRDCRHDEEPGCAVRKAVMSGVISPRRYRSFLRLLEEAG